MVDTIVAHDYLDSVGADEVLKISDVINHPWAAVFRHPHLDATVCGVGGL